MALWPDQDNELKAPERSNTDDSQAIEALKSKSEPPEDKKLITSPLEESETKKKDVHSLDDGQLKALLDEAIQYKNPKDREGKSKIFRELLQKVEDEIDCNSPIVGFRRKIGRSTYTVKEGNRIITVSERASRGGSLQNIFHAASSAEFDTHHTSGTRKKSKRQSPGSSVSSRQREGGSLPSNVNAGWPLESWQSDQMRKKGLFDRESQQQNHISLGLGNTASGVSSSVASSSTQARRQTLIHSASNELPSSRKQNSGELYPVRRHNSSSDQSKSAEVATTKLKTQSEGSSVVKKMPLISKPADYISFDMDLTLEMEPCGESDSALCFDKKFPININKKIRITPSGVESESANNNNSEVYTSRSSLEVDPMESVIDFDIVGKVNIGVELNEKYPAVQCIVGGSSKLGEGTNQGRITDQGGSRSHKYRNSISLVHISPKSTIESSRTDENGNALNLTSMSGRGSTLKKNHKRKLPEKNVVLSQNIAGFRGNENVDDLVNFIESDDYNKNKNLKKTLSKGKKHDKKRQNIQKSSSLEEISQRNIEDLTESSESQKNRRKTKVGSSEESGLRERRSWGDQMYVRNERQTITAEQTEDNNSDSDFQMVTKKQRKRKVNDSNTKKIRNHRTMKRSPRRKSTSSVPPSERSGDSDLDSIHSLPVEGAPITSYADIAAGNSNFFNSKEMSTFNKKESSQRKSASAKNNEIQEWCNSVSQHMENNIKNNNNNNNNNNNSSNNNTSNINKNNSTNNQNNINNNNNNNNINSNNNNNDSNYIYDINNINNNANNSISYLKNFSRQDDKKQHNLDVDQNGICDTNVRKLKDLVIVDKSIVDSEVTKSDKAVEPPIKTEFKKVASNCDLNQCKNVDNKNIEVKKNWNKKNFNREDFPSLPVKSDVSNYQKSKELSTDGNSFAKTKQYTSLSETDKQSNESKCDGIGNIKIEKKFTTTEDNQHRRSNRSKSVGPNTRPAVILLHDERTQDAGVREITFGFEVNEQLLTSDDSGLLFDEELESIENPSNSMKSVKIGGIKKKNCESLINDGIGGKDSNGGGIVYNDVIENRKALKNSSKATFGEITNSTVQELFKRHEIASRMIPHHSNVNNTNSANSIANKYVPPSSPIDFNHDKIVTFVGTAWEDVMRTGKIHYYSGEK